MKTISHLPFVLSLILCMSVLAGCANQTPVKMALEAHAGYDLTMSGLIEARRAGLISDSEKAQIEKVRAPVYDAMVALDKAAIEDNSTGAASALKLFQAELDSLNKYLLTYRAKTAATALK